MVLRDNLYYWEESLRNPEPIADDYYIYDEIIVLNENLIQKVARLRELIISYCVMKEMSENATSKILDEIYNIITSIDNIQYTEFVAFWKTLDISYSIFKKLPNEKHILKELLEKYCERRRKLYDQLGYSNVTVQALYDSGVSRKKGISGIEKLIDLVQKTFGNIVRIKDLVSLINIPVGYFLPDGGDEKLFNAFCNKFNLQYKFGKDHQGKLPDMVLKVNEHFFIIEAKHIKETGGAQDKQINEIIEFIRYTENLKNIHYLAFMDGIYFNNFIWAKLSNTKINMQRRTIEKYLKENKNNFFVNTAGFKALLKDLLEEIR
jgi:hypothetical protein